MQDEAENNCKKAPEFSGEKYGTSMYILGFGSNQVNYRGQFHIGAGLS